MTLLKPLAFCGHRKYFSTLICKPLRTCGFGKHTLAGVLHYQVIDERGNLSDETLDLAKTFKVGVPKGPEFSERHPVWANVLFQLEMIALFPLWLLSGMFDPSSC